MGTAINLHKGGTRTTSSEGCQTIHPSQWPAFVALVYSEMDRAGQKTIPYLLVEEEA
jgi:lysozyme